MPSVKLKRAGAWSTVGAGKVHIKQGAYGSPAWYRPGKIYRKIGAYGSPAWQDTGYVGPPGAPTNLHVTSWGYNAPISVAWTRPTGVVPASQYHIEVCNEQGQPVWGWYTAATSFRTPDGYNLAEDTKYQIRVEALSASGATSSEIYGPPAGGWVSSFRPAGWAYLRVGIGHSAKYQDVLVTKERSWSAGASFDNASRGASIFLAVNSNIRVDGCYINFKCTWGAGWVSIPGTAREVYPQRNSIVHFEEGAFTLNADPWAGWLPWVPEWGSGGSPNFGVYVAGDGWSEYGGPYYLYGSITLSGAERYQQWESQLSVAEQGNYYW